MLFISVKASVPIARTIFVVGKRAFITVNNYLSLRININMPKSKSKSRPAQPDALRAASPAVATRTRLALAGTDTPLAAREEADDQAAVIATPKEADNAGAGVNPPTQPRNHDSEESEGEYSTDSSLNEDAAATDAEGSRRALPLASTSLKVRSKSPFAQAAAIRDLIADGDMPDEEDYVVTRAQWRGCNMHHGETCGYAYRSGATCGACATCCPAASQCGLKCTAGTAGGHQSINID